LGVNEYVNGKYDLKYARPDAEALAGLFEGPVLKKLFSEVEVYSLVDHEVTKERVLKKVNEISQTMESQDVFVMTFSGHGAMAINEAGENQFFLIPSDMTQIYGNPRQAAEKGISDENLKLISMTIPAQKQLFILDACHSGGAINAMSRGVEFEQELARIAHASGSTWITASQEQEYAYELKGLSHGVFTYSILEILGGKVQNTATADNLVSVRELSSYVERRVPEILTSENRPIQIPGTYSFGNDFSIMVVK
jgi:uncharacterized caspase-like protein